MSGKVVKSKLKFKGESGKKKTLFKKKELTTTNDNLNNNDNNGIIKKDSNGDSDEIVIKQGTGRITSSSTTILGHYTVFNDELTAGDAIIITHPTSLLQETKIVRMVLSSISISVSSAFSSDLISTTSFKYIKAPKEEPVIDKDAEVKKAKKDKASEGQAFGEYISNGGQDVVYRIKTNSQFGGYKYVTEKAGSDVNRTDLLQLRSKKKGDRFCN
jgi:hypothetical protein